MTRRAASTSGFPDEPGLVSRPASLRPYKLASGAWVFLAATDAVPAGATAGALTTTGGGRLGLLTSTTSGKRLVRVPGAHIRIL